MRIERAILSVSDKAGNGTTATLAGIKIDRTAPLTAASAPGRWLNQSVTVTLAATDNLSGAAATYYAVDGGQTQSGTSVQFSAEGVYALTALALPMAVPSERLGGLYSFPRLALAAFPCLVALAILGRDRRMHVVAVAVLGALLTVNVVRWALWYWVA